MSGIQERLDEVRRRIDRALEAAARRPGAARLIGVSKRHEDGSLRAAYDAGLRDFGENYAQEFHAKATALAELEIRWHFIGAIQSNKAKILCDPAISSPMVHTVDRAKLVTALSTQAVRAGRELEVLIEVNFGEAQKAGVAPEDVAPLLEQLADAQALRCVGLMCIPPVGEPEETRKWFRSLAELRDALPALPGVDLRELSMGMSADFEVAIEEGATLVRVGTAIFGPRPG